jgi:hypothetical protein
LIFMRSRYSRMPRKILNLFSRIISLCGLCETFISYDKLLAILAITELTVLYYIRCCELLLSRQNTRLYKEGELNVDPLY